jgi:hypothetical protein
MFDMRRLGSIILTVACGSQQRSTCPAPTATATAASVDASSPMATPIDASAPDAAEAGAPHAREIATLEGVSKLAVDDAHVFVLNNDVLSFPKTGGSATNITKSNTPYPAQSMALDASFVYWAVTQAYMAPNVGPQVMPMIQKYPKNGGPAVNFLPFVPPNGKGAGVAVSAIAVDGTFAYWIDGYVDGYGAMAGDHVVRAPLSGGRGTNLGSTGLLGWAIAVDASNIYFATRSADGAHSTITRMPKAGGKAIVMVKDSVADDLLLDDAYVYWVANGLLRVDKNASGATPTDVVPTAVVATLDGADVYFADQHDDMWRGKKDGSKPPEKLDHAAHHVAAIAVDATDVYFVAGGSLMKLSK